MHKSRLRSASLSAVATFAVVGLLAGCGGNSSGGGSSQAGGSSGGSGCTTSSPCTAYISLNFAGNAIRQQFLKEVQLAQTTGELAGRVKVIVSSAGATVQDQAQDIQNIATKKPQILVVLPSSETGLDSAIQTACNAGVTVVSFDSPVQAPCAHNVGIDFLAEGTRLGAWLGEQAGGKSGTFLVDTGIPGIPFEVPADKGFEAGIKQTDPNATIVTYQGGIAAGPEKAAIANAAPAHKADLLGIAGITAGASIAAGVKEAGLPPVPMTDMTAVNADLQACLTAGQKCFYGATPGYEGAFGLREAVNLRSGQSFPNFVAVPPGWYSNAGTIKAYPDVHPEPIAIGKTVFPNLPPAFSLPYQTSWLPVTPQQVAGSSS